MICVSSTPRDAENLQDPPLIWPFKMRWQCWLSAMAHGEALQRWPAMRLQMWNARSRLFPGDANDGSSEYDEDAIVVHIS